jgi:cytochrome c-type biogenesis protein CcmH
MTMMEFVPGARRSLAALLTATIALAACSKKDDEGKPAGIPAAPATPGANQAPPTPAPLPPPAATAPAAPSGPAAPAAAGAAAAAPADAAPSAGGSIAGTVVLPGAHKKKIAPTDTLYVVARRLADNPDARGSLVAVKKLPLGPFPVPFTLSAGDMMIPSGTFEGELSLTVRLDKDGDPMTRKKGDLHGSLAKVRVGAKGVKLALDTVQKEDESLAAPGAPVGNPHGKLPPQHP